MIQVWLKQQWPLIWELAKTDFKLRYSGSHIGYVWALLFPLLSFLILNFVFSRLFTHELENYPLHLLTGLMLWTYFSEGTTVGLNALVAKRKLIIGLAVSKLSFIVSATIHATFTFVLNLIVLSFFFRYYSVTITVEALGYGLLFSVIAYCFILGFSLAAAPLFARWRDIGQVWNLVLRLGFFAAPIVYPLAIIPLQYQIYLWLNPMAYLIHYLKRVLIKQEFIEMPQLTLLLVLAGVSLLVGGYVFSRSQSRVAEYL